MYDGFGGTGAETGSARKLDLPRNKLTGLTGPWTSKFADFRGAFAAVLTTTGGLLSGGGALVDAVTTTGGFFDGCWGFGCLGGGGGGSSDLRTLPCVCREGVGRADDHSSGFERTKDVRGFGEVMSSITSSNSNCKHSKHDTMYHTMVVLVCW